MSMPSDFFLSSDPEQLRTDLNRLWKQLSYGINRTLDLTDFVDSAGNKLAIVYGDGAPGSGTYNIQEGRYIKNNNIVDYWFHLDFSAHTGAGAMVFRLPFVCRASDALATAGSARMLGIVAPAFSYTMPAGCTALALKAEPNAAACYPFAYGSAALSNLPMIASGKFNGYIRYIAEDPS